MGFGVAQFGAKVQSMTGQAEADYTQRHAAYDFKKLRGKQLITKLGRSRRYEVSPRVCAPFLPCTCCATKVILSVLAGFRTTQQHPQPILAPALDRHYERLRLDLQPLFQELGIAA
jgi:hypothetical protein